MQSTARERTQNLLLVSKLLDGRDSASPFTLVLDSIEQSAQPLIQRYVVRAKTTSTNVIFVSFETLRPPAGCHKIVQARDVSLTALHARIISACSGSAKTLIILDTLHRILESSTTDPSQWLSSLISPTAHLLSIYHTSIPLIRSRVPAMSYQPEPLTLLRFLATTIMTTHSLSHVLAAKAARDRSKPPPTHGLSEPEEGVVQGLGANDPRGVVVECEMRRRSGRTVDLTFVLTPHLASDAKKTIPFPGIVLLDDHPLYKAPTAKLSTNEALKDESEHGEVSFNLGLTERQRRERDGVVLPYFDAQSEGGPGEGGRILYDMGSEDDFDDEEDEI